MAKIFGKIYDNSQDNSWASSLRKKRFALFKSFIDPVQSPLKILDVGGYADFWNNSSFLNEDIGNIELTLINIDPSNSPIASSKIKRVVGDARNMKMFSNKEFDIVYSNSVIEHVGSYNDQRQLANEVMRVGKKYFIQTPNLYFLIEPHFVFPLFQFLPIELRVWIVTHFSTGWYGKISDIKQAKKIVSSIRLLNKKDFLNLFPEGKIWEEKILGLTKSFIAYGESK
jgi:hypothetical protein